MNIICDDGVHRADVLIRRARWWCPSGETIAPPEAINAITAGFAVAAQSQPPNPILCVRALSHHVRQTETDMRGNLRESMRQLLTRTAAFAARPSRGPVPSDARAVYFADLTELLNCLARDCSAGVANQRWWWPMLFPDKSPEAVLQQSGAARLGVPSWDMGPLPRVSNLAASLRWRPADAEPPGCYSRQIRDVSGTAMRKPVATGTLVSSPSTHSEAPALGEGWRQSAASVDAASDKSTLSGTSRDAAGALAGGLGVSRQRDGGKSERVRSFERGPARTAVAKEEVTLPTDVADLLRQSASVGVDPMHRLCEAEGFATAADANDAASSREPRDRTFECQSDETGPQVSQPPPASNLIALASSYAGSLELVNLAIAMGWFDDFTDGRASADATSLAFWNFLWLVTLRLVGPRFRRDPLSGLYARLSVDSGHVRRPSGVTRWAYPPIFPKGARAVTVQDRRFGGDPSPPQSEHYSLDGAVRNIRKRLKASLRVPTTERACRLLLFQPGRVVLSPGRLDVHLSLELLPIEIRLAGLDRNPGYIPAAARIVEFHYA